MQPNVQLNWLAIVACVVVSLAIGALWYGPLFGKRWLREMSFPEGTPQPSGAQMARSFALQIFGALLGAYVLSHFIAAWRPSSWNAGADASPAVK